MTGLLVSAPMLK